MFAELFGSVSRSFLASGLAYAAGRGWITSADVAPLVAAGSSLVMAAYSAFAKVKTLKNAATISPLDSAISRK